MTKEKPCEVLKEWIKPCENHLYWSALSTFSGDGDLIWAKFKSFFSHVINKHSDLDDPLFEKCGHREIRERNWLEKGIIENICICYCMLLYYNKLYGQHLLLQYCNCGNCVKKSFDFCLVILKWCTMIQLLPACCTLLSFHFVGTTAHEKLVASLTKPSLIKGIKQASPVEQTSSLEGFHSVVNHFSPKMIGYSYAGMYCRYSVFFQSFLLNSMYSHKPKLYLLYCF